MADACMRCADYESVLEGGLADMVTWCAVCTERREHRGTCAPLARPTRRHCVTTQLHSARTVRRAPIAPRWRAWVQHCSHCHQRWYSTFVDLFQPAGCLSFAKRAGRWLHDAAFAAFARMSGENTAIQWIGCPILESWPQNYDACLPADAKLRWT